MKTMILRNFNKKLFLLLAAAGMAGCVQDYGGGELPVPENGNEVTFTVTVPGQQIPTTRSIAGDAGESTVAFIDLLVFDTDGKFSRHVQGANIAPVAESENYKVTFKAELIAEVDDEMVVVLANVPPTTIEKMVKGDTKLVVLSKLTHTSLEANLPWKAAPGDYTPIPMYGEVSIGAIATTTVALTRMLARVDVVNSADGFTIKEICVVNYNKTGNIAPAWDDDGEIIKGGVDYPYTNNLNPTRLDNAWKQTGGKLTYDNLNIVKDVNDGSYLGEIYLYEAVKNPNPDAQGNMRENEDHTNAICLIVKGTYLGTDYYYRIDFTAGSGATTASETREYMPVYRNHLYTFDIEAVNGPGFPATTAGFKSALQSFGVLNNLKTKLHTVDMSGIKYMVFNGQHYLGINQSAFNLEHTLISNNELTILTNANDLKATTTTSWITLGTLQYVSGEKHTLSFDVSVNKGSTRAGTIVLTAGRLTYELTITQRRTCYPAYPGVIGYDPATDKLTIDGTGVMVYFMSGGAIALYAWLNDDEWSLDDLAFNPSTVAVNKNFSSIPYKTPSTFPNQSSIRTTGLGDPCRLIGLTMAQIEAGKTDNLLWRLPTGIPYEDLGTSNVIAEFNQTSGLKADGNIAKYERLQSIPVASGGHGAVGVVTLWGAAQTTYGDAELKLPFSGIRDSGGKTTFQGVYGYYNTSSSIGSRRAVVAAKYMRPSDNTVAVGVANSVRCVRQ